MSDNQSHRMEALEWWRQLSQLEQIAMVWKYSDEKDFVYVSKSSLQIQKLYIQATAYKTDAIAQNKWSIENREQLREQRKQELKELMEKDKQDHFVDVNEMIGVVHWLEQEFLKLESTVGVQGVFYELLEQAKVMEKKQHGQTWDDAMENMKARGGNDMRAYSDFDDYYNQRFGGNNEQ